MSDKALKISSGILSLVLLVTLIWKLQYVPGGMILSGLFLGIIMIIGILLGCLIAAFLLKLIFKKNSYSTLYYITTVISFLYFHFYLYSYSARLFIEVPDNYTGQINLVLSNVNDNYYVTVDKNGVGYISQWTFNHTTVEPQVFNAIGTNLKYRCIGFNSSNFWGQRKTCCIAGKLIKSLDFEITPDDKKGKKQYYSKDLTSIVDKKLIKLTEPDEYTKINYGSNSK